MYNGHRLHKLGLEPVLCGHRLYTVSIAHRSCENKFLRDSVWGLLLVGGIEYGRGSGLTQGDARELAAEQALGALMRQRGG